MLKDNATTQLQLIGSQHTVLLGQYKNLKSALAAKAAKSKLYTGISVVQDDRLFVGGST